MQPYMVCSFIYSTIEEVNHVRS